ncbi:MAG: hypothetical protein HY815_13990 [Candidatus Riflebacteria bacterium]|nr:hypothetical protein [Candidatus Riflebacteria bacterium]
MDPVAPAEPKPSGHGPPTPKPPVRSGPGGMPWRWLGWLWLLLVIFVVGGGLRCMGERREHVISDAVFAAMFGAIIAGLLILSAALLIGQAATALRRRAPWGKWAMRMMGAVVGLWVACWLLRELADASDGWDLVRPCWHLHLGQPTPGAPAGWMLFIAFVLSVIGRFRDPDPSPAFACLSFLVVGALTSAVLTPSFKAARERANTRACYANQKTVAGALEMYELDKNVKRPVIDRETFRLLHSGGYIQSIPSDPGFGAKSSIHYRWTGRGNGVSCRIHGLIQWP